MPYKKGKILRGVFIAVVLVYLLWLLGLPIFTLIKNAIGEGGEKIAYDLLQPDVLHAFYLTTVLSLGAVFFNTLFGTMLAVVLVRQKFAGQKIINGLLDLPFAISPVVVGYMFILLFGRQGWLEGLVRLTGIQWVFSLPGMLLATVFVTFPFVVREVIPVLQEVGVEQEQAAATLGASPPKIFWRITLPSIKWGLLYGISLTLARALGEFGAVLVVGAGIAGRTETATIYVYRAMDERLYAGAYGASLVLIAFSFLLLLGMELVRKRRQS